MILPVPYPISKKRLTLGAIPSKPTNGPANLISKLFTHENDVVCLSVEKLELVANAPNGLKYPFLACALKLFS